MTTLEDRLRAHYADRTAREPLPGPPADDALDALQRGEPRLVAVDGDGDRPGDGRPRRGAWARHHRGLLAAAAAVLVAVVVAGALVVTRDERIDVSTELDPPPSTTEAPTSTTTPSTTTTTEAPGTPGPSEGANPPPAGLIVAAEGVLGNWDGQQWVQWNRGQEPPGGDEYTVVRLDGPVGTQTGRVGPNTCGPAGEPTIELGLAADQVEYQPTPVGIAGVADPLPRSADVLDPGAAVYQQATADMAGSLGIDGGDPDVKQVVRADLDGDGTDEVLVAAERPGDGSTLLANDVAILFVRRVDGSAERADLVIGMYPGLEEAPGSDAYRISAIADLNGDGVMEVVVRSFAYEATWTLVFALDEAGVLRQALALDCGV